MNIIAGFILVLVVVYLLIKCILSYVEDRRYMTLQDRNRPREVELEMMPPSTDLAAAN